MPKRQKRQREQRPSLSVDDRFLRGAPAAAWRPRFLPVAGLECLDDFGLDCYLIEEDRRTWHKVIMVGARGATRVDFETLFGKEQERARYNRASFERVAATREPLHGTHHGFHDLFVPVVGRGKVCGFLASGPFITAPFGRTDIEQQWRDLTGGVPRAGDPDFLAYVRTVLATRMLTEPEIAAWTHSLVGYAALITTDGDGTAEFDALRRARDELGSAPPHLVRVAAAELIDRRHNAQWRADYNDQSRREAGLARIPNVVLAAAPRAQSGAKASRLDELLRGRVVQEACLAFCRAVPNTVAGLLGDAGCYVLTHVGDKLAKSARKSALAKIGRALRDAAKTRCAADLSVGVGPLAPRGEGLPAAYDAAILALQLALHEGSAVRFHEGSAGDFGSRDDLRALIADLRRQLEHGSLSALEIGLDRFMRHVVSRARGSHDALRAYCEMAFVELSEIIVRAAVTDDKSLRAMLSRIGAELDDTDGLMAPIDVLRRAVIDLRGLLERPAQADREAKVARAMQLVKRNLGDKVRLRDIAREVGFAPGYLSKLFRQRAGEGLRDYRTRLRVERAKTLLRTTDVPIGRIASAAGFISRANFFAAFRKLVGMSPGAYRARRK